MKVRTPIDWTVIIANVTEAEYLKKMAEWGSQQCGANLHWNLKAIKERKRTGDTRRIALCAFAQDAGCPYRLEIICKDGLYTVSEGSLQHSDHNVSSFIRGAALMHVSKLTPTKLKGTNVAAAIKELKDDGFEMDSPQERSFRFARQSLKRKKMCANLEPGTEGTWGAVVTVAQRYVCDDFEREGFNEHTVYVVGDILSDSSKGELVLVLSSDNLLLNGYRALQFGMPLVLYCDCTYRLMVEGHGTMLLGTMDLSQHFHVLAYAIITKEDTGAHEHVMRVVKQGVEDVVARYAREGKQI